MSAIEARVASLWASLATPSDADGLRRRTRGAVAALAVAVVAYVIAALHLTRGSVATFDSMTWLTEASSGSVTSDLLTPHNGHLIAVTRVIYAAGVRLGGSDTDVPMIALILAVAATAVLLFALLRKRVDPIAALAGSVIVLFLGVSPVVLDPTVAVFAQTTAFGLGALLALERHDRIGDAVACVLLIGAVAAFSAGLAFALGAAAVIALGSDRWRRAWVPVVPIALYVIWFLLKGDLDDGGGSSSLAAANALLIPSFSFDSLAAGLGAASGLGRDLSGATDPGEIAIGWGRILAAGLIVLLVLRLRESVGPRSLFLIVTAVAYWSMTALAADEFRSPQLDRYAFISAVLVLLLVAELPRGSRLTRLGALLVIGAALFALLPNVQAMREQGSTIRSQSQVARADLGTVEIAAESVAPDALVSNGLLEPITAGQYLGLAGEHGDLGFTADELAGESEGVRAEADVNLIRILGIAPAAAEGDEPFGDECFTADEEFEVPGGGITIASRGAGEVSLRRFADVPQESFTVPADDPILLAIPPDEASQPWLATVTADRPARVCPAGDL